MSDGQERAAFEASIQNDAQLAWNSWQTHRKEMADVWRDAMRYRWLRAQNWNDSEFCVVQDPKRTVRIGTFCPSNELLDAAIDDSMRWRKGLPYRTQEQFDADCKAAWDRLASPSPKV